MSEQIHRGGAEVIAVSVDSDARNAAMFQRWPTPHVLYVSDPGGEKYLRAMDMFDPDERDGIAMPGLFVIDPEGREVFGYRGRDFADRTHDADLLDVVDGLGLEPIEPPAGGPVDADVDLAQSGAFRPELFGPYFAGNRFGAIAIGGRAEGDEATSLAREHRKMAESMLEAWKQVGTR